MHKIACPSCGHTDESEEKLSEAIFLCGECRTRIAYGHAMPNVEIVQAHRPDLFALVIQTPNRVTTTLVDAITLRRLAAEIVSVL